MNAVERIQAAIDKLEVQKTEPQPPFLVFYDYDWVQDGNYDDLVQYVFDAGTNYGQWSERLRTIDAQLAILEQAANQYRLLANPDGWDQSIRASSFREQWEWDYSHALVLANAILGADE